MSQNLQDQNYGSEGMISVAFHLPKQSRCFAIALHVIYDRQPLHSMISGFSISVSIQKPITKYTWMDIILQDLL